MGRKPVEVIRATASNWADGRVVLALILAAMVVTGAGRAAWPAGHSTTRSIPHAAAAPLPAPGWTINLAPSFHLPRWPRPAWVSVPVATVWTHPATNRPEDSRAVSNRPDVPAWLTSLSVAQKLGLDNLLSTQSLLYQEVLVLSSHGGWDQVVVAGQTGSVFPMGIEGWIPASQLVFAPPPAAPLHVTVSVPNFRAGPVPLSYGTELPAQPAPGGRIEVQLPQGRFLVSASSVRESALKPSGAAVVAEAKRFVGLQYLWAGTSSFGFDCSGLTYTVYRQFNVTLPRDAADQQRTGRPVARSDLRPGDLVFFAFGPSVDHVGIYAGGGLMIDAPHTGAPIEVVPLWTPGLTRSYAGARRYI